MAVFDPENIKVVFDQDQVIGDETQMWLNETLDERITWLINESGTSLDTEGNDDKQNPLEIRFSCSQCKDAPKLKVIQFSLVSKFCTEPQWLE